jgi:hypothetical protein
VMCAFFFPLFSLEVQFLYVSRKGGLGIWGCGFWVWLGGGSEGHVIWLASTLISRIYTLLSSFILFLTSAVLESFSLSNICKSQSNLFFEMHVSSHSISQARHATSLTRVRTLILQILNQKSGSSNLRWCFANKPNSMSSTTFTGVLPKADRKAF